MTKQPANRHHVSNAEKRYPLRNRYVRRIVHSSLSTTTTHKRHPGQKRKGAAGGAGSTPPMTYVAVRPSFSVMPCIMQPRWVNSPSQSVHTYVVPRPARRDGHPFPHSVEREFLTRRGRSSECPECHVTVKTEMSSPDQLLRFGTVSRGALHSWRTSAV